jgi:hypothetical protein
VSIGCKVTMGDDSHFSISPYHQQPQSLSDSSAFTLTVKHYTIHELYANFLFVVVR